MDESLKVREISQSATKMCVGLIGIRINSVTFLGDVMLSLRFTNSPEVA